MTDEQPEHETDPSPENLEPDPEGDETDEPEGDTFGRDYVERLRSESAQHRRRAREQTERADRLAADLWRSRLALDGRLADPSDLPEPEDSADLTDDDVRDAVADLLARKPHLAARRARGRVGQGEPDADTGPSLASLLRAGA